LKESLWNSFFDDCCLILLTPMIIDAAERPADPACPNCGATLTYVDSEISSGAFRPQAASMAQMPIHYYDCAACNTCWKFGTKLLPDPIRQILKS
jgi:hypothetical protein